MCSEAVLVFVFVSLKGVIKWTYETLSPSLSSSLRPRLQPRGQTPPLGQGDSRSGALERLYLLEEQLSAIESTARTVEGEFRDSNQVRETVSRDSDFMCASIDRMDPLSL